MLQSPQPADNCRQTTAPLRDRCRGTLLGLALALLLVLRARVKAMNAVLGNGDGGQ